MNHLKCFTLGWRGVACLALPCLTVVKTCLRHAHDVPKMWPRHAQDTGKTFPWPWHCIAPFKTF